MPAACRGVDDGEYGKPRVVDVESGR